MEEVIRSKSLVVLDLEEEHNCILPKAVTDDMRSSTQKILCQCQENRIERKAATGK